MRNEPKQIIVHCSDYAPNVEQTRLINSWHKDRDFPLSILGWYVGYHYVIEKSGKIVQAREEWEEGAHTKGQNFNSIGVCLAGDFDVELPTDAQRVALGGLLAQICRRYSIPATGIVPHRRYSNKTCYGSLLDDQWAGRAYIQAEIDLLTKLLQWLRLNLSKPSPLSSSASCVEGCLG